MSEPGAAVPGPAASAAPDASAIAEASAGRDPWRRLDLDARGVWALVRRNLDVYLKTWKTNLVPPLLEPVLYLLALGYGLGRLIEEVDGLSYAAFIAPALLAITAMQGAFFETTYNSYVRMHFQKTWEAIVATPLTADDVMFGEILWAALRAAGNTTVMASVVALFGILSFPSALAIVPIAFLGGLTFASIGLLFTSKVRAIDQFSFAIYLFVTPMFLFAGTFFPLSQLPAWARAVAYALPLTHLVAPMRAAALGRWDPLVPWSLAYLAVGSCVLVLWAIAWGKRRAVT